MAFQSVPETAEIVIQYQGNSVTSHNVLHARKVGGYDLADLQLLAAAVDFDVGTDWLPIQTVDILYISTTVRGLEFLNDQEAINTTSAAAGAHVSEALPGNVTIAIKKVSGQTGRNARGRIFWQGLPTNQLKPNENQVTTLDVGAIVAACESVRSGIDATVWSPVIVSRFLNSVKRPFGVTFPWIQCVAVDEDVDSMRNRLL